MFEIALTCKYTLLKGNIRKLTHRGRFWGGGGRQWLVFRAILAFQVFLVLGLFSFLEVFRVFKRTDNNSEF